MIYIAENILLHLDFESLKRAESVCVQWARVIANGQIWKKMVENKVQTDSQWYTLCKRQKLIQYLYKPKRETENLSSSFYRSLYANISKHIENIASNWNTGVFNLTTIHCNSTESKGVYCLQYDEEKIVGGLRDNSIKVWNRNNLRCIKTLTGHSGSVLCLQFNERFIVTGSSDSTIRVWDINSGNEIQTYIQHTGPVLHLRFNTDTLVSCSRVSVHCGKKKIKF